MIVHVRCVSISIVVDRQQKMKPIFFIPLKKIIGSKKFYTDSTQKKH